MSRRLLLTAGLALVLAGGVACTGEAPTTPEPGAASPTPPPPPGGTVGTTAPDPCTLVTRAEAADALDSFVNAGIQSQRGGLPGQRDCAYFVTGSTTVATVSAVPGDQAKLEQLRDEKNEIPIKPLKGIGDSAFAADRIVYARKGGVIVFVTITGIRDDKRSVEIATALIKKAAGRL